MRAIDELHKEMLEGIPSDSPLTMINLIKFKERSDDGDGSGQDAYARYSRGIVAKLKEVEGIVEWAGESKGVAFGPAEWGDWDFIAKVSYPTKEHFLTLLTSSEFEAANHHRLNGVERHVIIATEEAFGPWKKD
jgi:hypothetical protein